MGREVTFSAELWRYEGEGGWHFVTLPRAAADEIEEEAPPGPGFGSVRVTATIGTTTWQTSVFPSRAEQSYLLPVKRSVRDANGLLPGDAVTVTLVVG